MHGMEETSRIKQDVASCFAWNRNKQLDHDINIFSYNGQKESLKNTELLHPLPHPTKEETGNQEAEMSCPGSKGLS